jgi:hypothetical protein
MRQVVALPAARSAAAILEKQDVVDPVYSILPSLSLFFIHSVFATPGNSHVCLVINLA